MRKYIDPEHLKAVIKDHTYLLTDHINSTGYGMFWCGIEHAIDEEPEADVRENTVGAWVWAAGDTVICNRCGYPIPWIEGTGYEFGNYCPQCGADMRCEKVIQGDSGSKYVIKQILRSET